MNNLCTKQPLNKSHPYNITAKMLFPKGGHYRGVPLYIQLSYGVTPSVFQLNNKDLSQYNYFHYNSAGNGHCVEERWKNLIGHT